MGADKGLQAVGNSAGRKVLAGVLSVYLYRRSRRPRAFGGADPDVMWGPGYLPLRVGSEARTEFDRFAPSSRYD